MQEEELTLMKEHNEKLTADVWGWFIYCYTLRLETHRRFLRVSNISVPLWYFSAEELPAGKRSREAQPEEVHWHTADPWGNKGLFHSSDLSAVDSRFFMFQWRLEEAQLRLQHKDEILHQVGDITANQWLILSSTWIFPSGVQHKHIIMITVLCPSCLNILFSALLERPVVKARRGNIRRIFKHDWGKNHALIFRSDRLVYSTIWSQLCCRISGWRIRSWESSWRRELKRPHCNHDTQHPCAS